jgi:hypothetical protein
MEVPQSHESKSTRKQLVLDILICSAGWELSILLLWIIKYDSIKMAGGSSMLAMAVGVNMYSLFINHGKTKYVYLMAIALTSIGFVLGFAFDTVCADYVTQRRLAPVLAIGLAFGTILGCCVSAVHAAARYLVGTTGGKGKLKGDIPQTQRGHSSNPGQCWPGFEECPL